MVRGVAAFVLDLLFPRRCVFCGKVQGFKEKCACGGEKKVQFLDAGALPPTELEGECLFDSVWAAALYDGVWRQMILRYKFEGERQLAPYFAHNLAGVFDKNGLHGNYDIVVASPVSKRTMKKRGYNQSVLLAKCFADEVRLPFAQALHKNQDTVPQMELNRAGRLVNLKNTFEADSTIVNGARVLIVDDIMTTGSTLNEAARALICAGAVSCSGLCVAYTPFD